MRVLLALIGCLLYLAHQDLWLWRGAHPLVFGFLPVGLAYHVGYTVAAAVYMALLVRFAWPESGGDE
jgi:hypothetical protein